MNIPRSGDAKSDKQLSTWPYSVTHASCLNASSCIRILRDERMAIDDERVMRDDRVEELLYDV